MFHSTQLSTQVSIYTDYFNNTYFTFFKFLMNIDVKKITSAETGRNLFLQKPVSAETAFCRNLFLPDRFKPV